MRTPYLLLLASLLAAASCRKNNSPEPEPAKPQVHDTTCRIYSEISDEDSTYYNYNEKGQLTNIRTINETLKVERTFHYENGLLHRVEEKDLKANKVSRKNYHYNGKQLVDTIFYNRENNTFTGYTAFKYDSFNRPVERVEFDKSGEPWFGFLLEYDNKGNVARKHGNDGGGNFEYTYKYDDKPQIYPKELSAISPSYINPNNEVEVRYEWRDDRWSGSNSSARYYIYTYDEKGRLFKRDLANIVTHYFTYHCKWPR